MPKFLKLLIFLTAALVFIVPAIAGAHQPDRTPARSEKEKTAQQREYFREAISELDDIIANTEEWIETLAGYGATNPPVSWAGKIPGWIAVLKERVAGLKAQAKVLEGFLEQNEFISDDEKAKALAKAYPDDSAERESMVFKELKKPEVRDKILEYYEKRHGGN